MGCCAKEISSLDGNETILHPDVSVVAGYAIYDDVIWGVGKSIVAAATDAEDMLNGDSEERMRSCSLNIKPCSEMLMDLVKSGVSEHWEEVLGIIRVDCGYLASGKR